MVGKWESGNWLIFARSAGDWFKLPSIASLLFETSSRMLMVVGMVFAANKRRQIFQGWLS